MIVVEPGAELLAYTRFAPHLGVEDPCSEMARVVERCGRVSWRSEDKAGPGTAEGFCVRVVNIRKDESIAEHASATLLLTTDRYTTHQLVRHRIGAYTQASTHYINLVKRFGADLQVCRPLGIPEGTPEWEVWKGAVMACEAAYTRLVAAGVKHYHARFALPGCLATQIAVTYNLRMWRYVLGLRTPPNNTPEIRYVMWRAALILADLCPEIMGEWRAPGEEYFGKKEWTK